jgi:phage repressor protein C with HTH and peptisase S24 domain
MEDSLHEPLGYIPLMPGLKHPQDCYYVLKASGTSMNLVFPDGALLICLDIAKSGIPVVDNDIVIVENRREQAGFREISAKRVKMVRGVMQFRPESSDPKHSKPLVVTTRDGDDSAHVLARVEGAYTQF